MHQAQENERGAVLVEFGLIAPIMIALLLGMVQFGLVLNQVQGLHAAAREGARTAAIPDANYNDINQTITTALAGVTSQNPTITITTDSDEWWDTPCEDRAGQSVEVTIDSTYELSIPFLAGQTLNLQGKGTFRCET